MRYCNIITNYKVQSLVRCCMRSVGIGTRVDKEAAFTPWVLVPLHVCVLL